MKPYQIILQQLGGNQFIAMTGAQLRCNGDNSLIASIKGSRKYNRVVITLNDLDLYDVRFIKQAGVKQGFRFIADKTTSGVYCDQLKPIIEKETGLYLSL